VTGLAGLPRRRVVLEVPATSANLGSGYDVLAVALDLRNRIEVEALDEPGLELEVQGEGEHQLPRTRENRFILALETGLRWALGDVPHRVGWRVRMRNRIPLARGLGSSAAATVAGLMAGDTLTGRRIDRLRLLTLAAELEGHPENAAAAMLGGFVVAVIVEGRAEAIRFEPPPRIRAVLFVPDLPLATSEMRAVLPHAVPHRDAAFNVGRVALGVAGIATGRYDLLRVATEDRLHEPYRARAFPALPRLIRAAREAGAIGACLSGAGSSVIAFGDSMTLVRRIERAFAAAAAELQLAGTVATVSPEPRGATVINVR
jgi:homoserine kinase